MPTFKLTQGEIIEILDKLSLEAYDNLQAALESKVCEVLSTEKWLDIWEGGNWKIEMTLSFEPVKELQDEDGDAMIDYVKQINKDIREGKV
jgi:hypothetical protein